jgi:hypothetical protein
MVVRNCEQAAHATGTGCIDPPGLKCATSNGEGVLRGASPAAFEVAQILARSQASEKLLRKRVHSLALRASNGLLRVFIFSRILASEAKSNP